MEPMTIDYTQRQATTTATNTAAEAPAPIVNWPYDRLRDDRFETRDEEGKRLPLQSAATVHGDAISIDTKDAKKQ
ncbi:hypothetical protein TYRP_010152 [Tyrophagus putrescentiae]|nr:hypothetical protein TYRP_010152 [Tyrophagus putrescentiae]